MDEDQETADSEKEISTSQKILLFVLNDEILGHIGWLHFVTSKKLFL